jgi:uncharacterized protein YcnI
MRNRIALALLFATALPAGAHVTLVDPNAKAGSNFVAEFRVGHGCAGSPTTALTITLPESVISAKPKAKPGWTISMTHAPSAKSVAGEGGRPVTERVSSITWNGGSLANDQFDDFAILVRLPDAAAPLNFQALQVCDKGSENWAELADGSGKKLSHPAPVLTVTAKGDTP